MKLKSFLKINNPMKKLNALKAAILFIAIFTTTSVNAQQVKMSIQGILKRFNGTIVTDGSYNVNFKLYNVTSGGTALWTESQTIITEGGLYNTVLGSTALGLSELQNLAYDAPYYLGITIVGSQEMAPRTELTGSPFAIRANTANYANGLVLPGNPTITSNVGTGDLILAGATPTSNVIIQGSNLLVDTIEAAYVDDKNAVGTVLAFFGTTANIPKGYKICDGSSLLRTTYSRLFNVIGTASGTINASSFNVPDLRGQFLRGVSGAATTDPDRTARTADNTGGNTGNAVGSQQTDAAEAHTHTFSDVTTSNGDHTHSTASEFRNDMYTAGGTTTIWAFNIEGGTTSTNTYSTDTDGAHTHNVSGITATGTGTTSTETRPNNIYCYYIIKY
jgi:microcystin-dependent protein